jgi:hypothetical protein
MTTNLMRPQDPTTITLHRPTTTLVLVIYGFVWNQYTIDAYLARPGVYSTGEIGTMAHRSPTPKTHLVDTKRLLGRLWMNL